MTRNLGSLKIRKYQDNLKIGWGHSLATRVPTRNQFSAIAIKNYAKSDIKVFNGLVKFCKKRCSQKFRKTHRKHLCQSLFFNKAAKFLRAFFTQHLWMTASVCRF